MVLPYPGGPDKRMILFSGRFSGSCIQLNLDETIVCLPIVVTNMKTMYLLLFKAVITKVIERLVLIPVPVLTHHLLFHPIHWWFFPKYTVIPLLYPTKDITVDSLLHIMVTFRTIFNKGRKDRLACLPDHQEGRRMRWVGTYLPKVCCYPTSYNVVFVCPFYVSWAEIALPH